MKITKSELKKRQETADKVRDQLGEKAILNGRESDQKHSQYPPELRALARASSGLKQWGGEDRSEDIRLFYEYRDDSPCNDRMLDYNTSIIKAVLALQNSGKDGLAFRIENKWKKVKEFAEQSDDTISVLRRQFINESIDENTFSKKVRTAVHLARGTALALGRRLELVVKQQIEDFESKLSASGSKADLPNEKPAGTGQDITPSKRRGLIAWLKNHPHSYGLTGGFIFLILFLVLGLFKAQWRQWCWGVAGLAFLALVLSLLGGRSR